MKCPYCSADRETGENCPIDNTPCNYNPDDKCENCKEYNEPCCNDDGCLHLTRMKL